VKTGASTLKHHFWRAKYSRACGVAGGSRLLSASVAEWYLSVLAPVFRFSKVGKYLLACPSTT
jgi:hypothetical protein